MKNVKGCNRIDRCLRGIVGAGVGLESGRQRRPGNCADGQQPP